jgi:hypothetical protein
VEVDRLAGELRPVLVLRVDGLPHGGEYRTVGPRQDRRG